MQFGEALFSTRNKGSRNLKYRFNLFFKIYIAIFLKCFRIIVFIKNYQIVLLLIIIIIILYKFFYFLKFFLFYFNFFILFWINYYSIELFW